MTRAERARTTRVPYSRLVAHFLRHLEATTSLPLGGRLSEAPRDPAAAPFPTTRPGEIVGGSLPLGSRIGTAALRSLRSLRLASMTPAELPASTITTRPRQATPVRARGAGGEVRTAVRHRIDWRAA
jgi:hypothetical protein